MQKETVKGEDGSGKVGRDGKETNEVDEVSRNGKRTEQGGRVISTSG